MCNIKGETAIHRRSGIPTEEQIQCLIKRRIFKGLKRYIADGFDSSIINLSPGDKMVFYE